MERERKQAGNNGGPCEKKIAKKGRAVTAGLKTTVTTRQALERAPTTRFRRQKSDARNDKKGKQKKERRLCDEMGNRRVRGLGGETAKIRGRG